MDTSGQRWNEQSLVSTLTQLRQLRCGRGRIQSGVVGQPEQA